MCPSNPQMQAMMDANPQIRHVLNDPSVLRQTMEMMRNPNAMQQVGQARITYDDIETYIYSWQHTSIGQHNTAQIQTQRCCCNTFIHSLIALDHIKAIN